MKIGLSLTLLITVLFSGMVFADFHSDDRGSSNFSGPGGCEGFRECQSYCNDEANREECVRFAKTFDNKEDFRNEFKGQQRDHRNIDPVEMVIGQMFHGSDLNQKDFVQYCPDTEAMVDAAIEELKAQGKWDFTNACSQIESNLDRCEESSSRCGEILKAPALTIGGSGSFSRTISTDSEGNIIEEEHSDFTDEQIITCDDLDKDILYENCLERHGALDVDSDEMCEERWDRSQERRADNENDFCDYEGSENDRFCNEDLFIEDCKQELERNLDQQKGLAEESCKDFSSQTYSKLLWSCEERNRHYDQCIERSEKACGFMESALERCEELTEDDVRDAMIKQADKFCRFDGYDNNRRRIGDRPVSEVVKLLQEARDSAPVEYQPIIDEDLNDILDATDEVAEAKEVNLGRRLKWLIGAAATEERKDAEKMRASADKLDATINGLRSLLDEIDDPSLEALIQEQIDNLENQVEELNDIADRRERRAKGISSFLSRN